MCGEPDFCLLFWQWDAYKLLSKIKLGLNDVSVDAKFNLSGHIVQTDLFLCVSGPEEFRFMRCHYDMSGVDFLATQLNAASPMAEAMLGERASKNITCHAWSTQTDRLIACTDTGDILTFDFNGQFEFLLIESPSRLQEELNKDYLSIRCIVPHQHGFIVAGDKGSIWTYEHTH